MDKHFATYCDVRFARDEAHNLPYYWTSQQKCWKQYPAQMPSHQPRRIQKRRNNFTWRTEMRGHVVLCVWYDTTLLNYFRRVPIHQVNKIYQRQPSTSICGLHEIIVQYIVAVNHIATDRVDFSNEMQSSPSQLLFHEPWCGAIFNRCTFLRGNSRLHLQDAYDCGTIKRTALRLFSSSNTLAVAGTR
jgi:hypothetical protein